MGVGTAEIKRLWERMAGGPPGQRLWPRLVREGEGAGAETAAAPDGATAGGEVVAGAKPLPEARRCAPGRLRSFALRQRWMLVDGLRTAFCDAGVGPAVVFVHGAGGNLTHWAHVALRFVEGNRVVALDLPGCGESEGERGAPLVQRGAAQLGRLLDALGIESAAVVGHGLGAAVAVELSLRRPSLVTGLALFDPAGLAPAPVWPRVAGEVLLRTGLMGSLLPSVWRRALEGLFVARNEYTSAFVHELVEGYTGGELRVLAEAMAGLRVELLGRDVAGTFEYVGAPTLLAWGDGDRLVDRRAMRALAERRRGTLVREIRGCGMMPIIERPGEVAALVREFLARSGPAARAVPSTSSGQGERPGGERAAEGAGGERADEGSGGERADEGSGGEPVSRGVSRRRGLPRALL
ncbi:MAG: alpha/beta fold hydrolase [Deltaproteobacteria bacterium]|nr:alpha/beta fold hydrolase [Deltaproteobacteria bacterium]